MKEFSRRRFTGWIFLLVTLFVFILILGNIFAADWWTFHGANLNNTRYINSSLNITDFGILWSFSSGGGSSEPVISEDVVYFGGGIDGFVYALNATNGSRIWNYTLGSSTGEAPAVEGGVVYTQCAKTLFCALNATNGSQIWNYSIGENGDGDLSRVSATVSGGVVYVPAVPDDFSCVLNNYSNGTLYALYLNGTKKWSFLVPGPCGGIWSPPAVVDNIIYIGSGNTYFYEIYASNGTQKCNYSVGQSLGGNVAIENGLAYYTTTGSYGSGGVPLYFGLFILNTTTCTQFANYTLNTQLASSDVVVRGGVAYFGSQTNTYFNTSGTSIYAVYSNGSLKWERNISYQVQSLSLAGDGLVFTGWNVPDSSLFGILNVTNGNQIFNLSFSNSLYGSSTSASNNIFYVSGIKALSSGTLPIITLNSPAPDYVNESHITNPSLNDTITFNCTATDPNNNLASLAVYFTNSTNGNFTSRGTSSTVNVTRTETTWTFVIGPGNYTWNCRGIDSLGNIGWGSSNRTIFINMTYASPVVNLISPENNYWNATTTYVPVNFSCNATDAEGNLNNLSLYLTNSSNSNFNLNQTTNITGYSNESSWIVNLSAGTYKWNCLSYDNVSNPGWASSNRTLAIYGTAPVFSNYADNSFTLIDNGTATFNVSVANTNGTVFFHIKGQNYSATSLGSDIYAASVNLTRGAVYNYYWFSYGPSPAFQYNSSSWIKYILNSSASLDSWPTLNYDAARTGYNTNAAINISNLSLLWVNTGVTGSYEPIVANGILYVNGKAFYADNGSQIWSRTAIVLADGTYTIGTYPTFYNGTVYVSGTFGGSRGIVVALDAETGDIIWYNNNTGVTSYSAVVDNQFLVTDGDKIYSMNLLTGSLNWAHTLTEAGGLFAVSDGKIFVPAQYVSLFDVLNISDGNHLWSYDDGTSNNLAGTVVYNNVTYLLEKAPEINNLYAFNASNGTKILNVTISGTPNGKLILQEGILYFSTSAANQLYAVNATNGSQIWNYSLTLSSDYSSSATEGSALFFNKGSNGLYALNASAGNYLWNYSTGTQGSPIIVGDRIYILTNQGLYAFEGVFSSDTTYPIFSTYGDNNGTLLNNGTAQFNVTVENTNGTVLLNINGSSLLATNLTSNVYNVSLTLTYGTYAYNWSAYGNGTSHNLNWSVQRSYTVNSSDMTPPIFVEETPQNQTLLYNEDLSYIINASDPSGISSFAVNDSRFKISTTQINSTKSSGLLENNSAVGVGLYYLNITINDTLNNLNSTIMFVNITKANSAVYLYLNNSRANLTVQNTTLVRVNSTLVNGSGLVQVYANGSLFSNGTSSTTNSSFFYAVELYNITAIYGGNENYTGSSETFYLNVTLDNSNPLVTINSPNATTYTTSTVRFNVSTNEFAICNYTFNSSISNYSMTASNSNTSFYSSRVLTNGNYNVSFYCWDLNENLNNTEFVVFTVALCVPDCSAAGSHCSGTTFDDGCAGTCAGTQSCGCFIAGTPILMADTSYKPIEEVKAGEQILSWDLEKEKLVQTKVGNTWKGYHEDMFIVLTEDGKEIGVTSEHPFWTEEAGWAAISPEKTFLRHGWQPTSLEVGYHFMNFEGESVQIIGIIANPGEIMTYNLVNIENYNNYFASDFLVHNKGCDTKSCSDYGSSQCGTYSDGCGGTISCGSCAVGFSCSSGLCVPDCSESWTCGEWTTCTTGTTKQSRLCTDPCTQQSSIEEQTCSCGSTTCGWTTCAEGDEYSYPYDCVNSCGSSSEIPKARKCGTEITEGETSDKKGGGAGPSCTPWGKCEADYSLTDILNENYQFKGLQKRTCKLENSSVMESKPCSLEINIRIEKKERCFENYFEIYDESTNTLIGRIKKSSIKEYSNLTRVDINFPIQEVSEVCEHCFDEIQNYDEEGVDCGGEHCEVCTTKKNFFNWLFYLVIALWAGFVGSFVYFSKVMRVVGDPSEAKTLFRNVGKNTPVENRFERRILRFFRRRH